MTDTIQDGCLWCHGQGDVPEVFNVTGSRREPCPECERVRGLLKAERERCARLVGIGCLNVVLSLGAPCGECVPCSTAKVIRALP